MANFLEDPRLRQRWNQISHNAEAVTENAAAGIWNFGQNYINPCVASISNSVDQCATLCLGDPEERVRKKRERERARGAAEYSFDFYDDWYADDEGGSGGILGGWNNEDWDRLLAGTGSSRRHGAGEVSEQPKRKRGMSYGTRSARRKAPEEDPTIIPSTQPIGFLGKLPWKIGGTLRYKPSAADLQDHPGRHEQMGETEPLLGTDSEDDYHPQPRVTQTRKRSGTTGSGDTSDSFRSRGDLFPSDGEGDEDAIPLDDEFTVALDKVDDRSSNKTRSSKGKRRADERDISRTVSITTIGSSHSRRSLRGGKSSQSISATPEDISAVPSMEDLQREEQQVQQEEDDEVERKRTAAAQLAARRGLGSDEADEQVISEVKPEIVDVHEVPEPANHEEAAEYQSDGDEEPLHNQEPPASDAPSQEESSFIPARLPHFR